MSPAFNNDQRMFGSGQRKRRMYGFSRPILGAPVKLPAELSHVIEARNQIVVTGRPDNLYSRDALVLDPATTIRTS